MNLVAMIGIVDSIKESNDKITNILLKVEKPFIQEGSEEYYDKITVNVNSLIFKDILKLISTGKLIGFKGRISIEKNINQITVEKLQIF